MCSSLALSAKKQAHKLDERRLRAYDDSQLTETEERVHEKG
jgi:hypothetical protein